MVRYSSMGTENEKMTLEELNKQIAGMNPTEARINMDYVGRHPKRKPFLNTCLGIKTEDADKAPSVSVSAANGKYYLAITHKKFWSSRTRTDTAEFPSLESLANFVEDLKDIENGGLLAV